MTAFLETDFGKKTVRFFSNLIVRRWIETLSLAISVFVLFPVIERPLIRLSAFMGLYADSWPLYVVLFIVFMSSILISHVLVRVGSMNPDYSFMTMIKYPPVWVVALLGAFAFVLRAVMAHQIPILYTFGLYSKEVLSIIVAVTSGVFIVLVGKKFDICNSPKEAQKRRQYTNPDGNAKKMNAKELRLLNWVINEAPIRTKDDDRYSHDIQAKRIASLLMQESPSSIGIVGPFGAGKSCLIELVEGHLSKEPQNNIITCKIDGWGHASGLISHHILAMAVEKVKQHIDCLSILTLPENYRQAIGEAKAPAGAIIAALLQTSHDPIIQLAKLDQLLKVANSRLVIILEDLDRNVSDKALTEEIPALLDRLRKLRHVSFILAIGTEKNYSHILVRICDYLEAVI